MSIKLTRRTGWSGQYTYAGKRRDYWIRRDETPYGDTLWKYTYTWRDPDFIAPGDTGQCYTLGGVRETIAFIEEQDKS